MDTRTASTTPWTVLTDPAADIRELAMEAYDRMTPEHRKSSLASLRRLVAARAEAEKEGDRG